MHPIGLLTYIDAAVGDIVGVAVGPEGAEVGANVRGRPIVGDKLGLFDGAADGAELGRYVGLVGTLQ
jgi:hypothetical protein